MNFRPWTLVLLMNSTVVSFRVFGSALDWRWGVLSWGSFDLLGPRAIDSDDGALTIFARFTLKTSFFVAQNR